MEVWGIYQLKYCVENNKDKDKSQKYVELVGNIIHFVKCG